MRIVMLALLACVCFGVGGCGLPSFLVTPVARVDGLQEETVEPGSRAKVLVVPIEGLLVNSRTGGGLLGGPGENKVSLLKEQLDKAAGDDRVVAVVLRVSSPGGTVSASDAMYEIVRDFRERTGRPVVASVQEVGASGGYYVALAADELHAQPTSIVGSVGVLIQTFDASGTLDMVGLRSHTLTSGPLKDMGSPLNELTDPERDVLQGLVDSYHTRFADKLRENRPGVSDFATATDGRVFSGEQALAVGLVDEVGFLDDAIDRARELADEPEARAVLYKRPYGYDGSIYAATTPPTPNLPAARPLIELPETATLAPGAYYLYR